MGKRSDKPVSVPMWMALIFLAALPCIGWVLIVVLAFVGENQTRKNYFRALMVWFLIIAVIGLTMMLLGFWPVIEQQTLRWIDQLAKPK